MDGITAADPSSLVDETADALGELFGAGTAGAIPDGRGKGTVLLGTGGRLTRVAAAVCYALAWRGKVVNAREARLKNIVTPLGIQAIEAVYGDIERVDLTVGMYAEPRPAGFAFSDTAFRIFILMASRRLNSDRFFTTDYTPAVYTQAGLDWINDNSMTSVLLRHYPQLRPALGRVPNAFTPWARAAMTA